MTRLSSKQKKKAVTLVANGVDPSWLTSKDGELCIQQPNSMDTVAIEINGFTVYVDKTNQLTKELAVAGIL